jgi:DNA-binding NarL/FixJ family response regulator
VIRVLICDDHAMVREALTWILNQSDNVEVVAATTGCDDTIDMMSHTEVDVAIIDVRLVNASGLTVASWIQKEKPQCKVILLTAFVSDEVLVEAAEVGAVDVLEKTAASNELLNRVQDVASGMNFLDGNILREARERLNSRGVLQMLSLDATDKQILSLIGKGMTDKQIGENVYLSAQTVRNRVSRMLTELGKENRTQLALLVTGFDNAAVVEPV